MYDNNFNDLEQHYLYDLPEDREYRTAEYHCDICGSPISDYYYNINGDIICQDCLDEMYKEYI